MIRFKNASMVVIIYYCPINIFVLSISDMIQIFSFLIWSENIGFETPDLKLIAKLDFNDVEITPR